MCSPLWVASTFPAHLEPLCQSGPYVYLYIYIIISCMIKQLSHINNKVFKKKKKKTTHLLNFLSSAQNSHKFIDISVSQQEEMFTCAAVSLCTMDTCTLAIPAALVNSAYAWRQAAAASARQACILTPSSTQWVTTLSDRPRLL